MKRDIQVQIRLSPVEDAVFKNLADDLGLTQTAWIRMTCREKAIREAEALGLVNPFKGHPQESDKLTV